MTKTHTLQYISNKQFHSIISVPNGVYALGKVQIPAIPSVRSFSSETLLDDGSLASFQGRALSASSLRLSPQAIENVGVVLACMSEVSQHFRSSETQVSCDNSLARQSVTLVLVCLFLSFFFPHLPPPPSCPLFFFFFLLRQSVTLPSLICNCSLHDFSSHLSSI